MRLEGTDRRNLRPRRDVSEAETGTEYVSKAETRTEYVSEAETGTEYVSEAETVDADQM